MDSKIAVFKGKEVRRILFQSEWSCADIVAVLTDSENPRDSGTE